MSDSLSSGRAALDEMAAWARTLMSSREPDFVVGPENDPQMRRWWIVPRNSVCNVYLHQFLRSDDDRALHDHPGDNVSWILSGLYVEHFADYRRAGALGRSSSGSTQEGTRSAPGAGDA